MCGWAMVEPAGGKKFITIAGYLASGEAARTLLKYVRQALNPLNSISAVNSFN